MKQRIALLTGLTAVSLLILVSCTQPTTPEPTTLPTVVPTSAPTTAPDPTPTSTPTAEEQANQLLLNNGRFTTLLDELTQEIGRGLSDAEQAQVLALARALWLPGHLDESDWRPDPAGVTLHWRPMLDGREGPVLRVVEAQPDSPYAAGALIFWRGERLLSLTPTQPGYYFEFGRIQQNIWDFETWVEYDAEGNVVSFVHPDTMQYVTPESEDWRIFTLSDLDDQGNRVNERLYWENGGTPTEITTGPDNVPIADFLADNPNLQLTQTEQNGQPLIALIDAQTNSILFTLNLDALSWQEARSIGEVRQGEEILQVWDGQEWVDMHRNLAVLNGELKIYNESSNQWNTYPIPPELQQVIASENWELRKVSLSEARNKQFLVIENQEGNPVLTWDEFTKEFVRSYYADYYGRGPLRIYPAIEFQVIDPKLLEQRINSLGQVEYQSRTHRSHFTDLNYSLRINNLLVTGISHHAVSQDLASLTQVHVTFKNQAGSLETKTIVFKGRTGINTPGAANTLIEPPPISSIQPGDIITAIAQHYPVDYTSNNPDPDRRMSYQKFRERYVNPPVLIAAYLWDEARISTEQLLTELQNNQWSDLGGLDDRLLLFGGIDVIDRPHSP
jgi:hypothetical protein